MALDLTPDEVVLHEGNARDGWRRFAGVPLDDPEFLAVIGLLRAEAEEAFGGPRPVRLWLPADQVLAVAMPIAEADSEARLHAAFARIGAETGHDPDEVAIAVSPAGAATATLLVTHAETLHEARDYAARWGFVPGPVSTRHHAEVFAPAEPVFRLRSTVEKRAPADRHAVSWMALGLACLAGALAVSPADASQAPREAPLPLSRLAGASAGEPLGEMTIGPSVAAALPSARSGAVDRGAVFAPLPPVREAPGAAAADVVAPAPVEEPRPGGRAAPLPEVRPDRPAAPDRTRSAPALPAIGTAAPPPVRAAASERGLPVDRVALIGILNLDTGREALLRFPDGVFRSVRVGDVIHDWRVSAIGVDAMRVSRGGEDRTLLLVSR